MEWSQGDTASVIGYHIYMADTTAILDASFLMEWINGSLDTTFDIENTYTKPQTGDSTRYYFGVAAMNENGFTGPLSDVDSVDIVGQ